MVTPLVPEIVSALILTTASYLLAVSGVTKQLSVGSNHIPLAQFIGGRLNNPWTSYPLDPSTPSDSEVAVSPLKQGHSRLRIRCVSTTWKRVMSSQLELVKYDLDLLHCERYSRNKHDQR